jgi:hypothetical protein
MADDEYGLPKQGTMCAMLPWLDPFVSPMDPKMVAAAWWSSAQQGSEGLTVTTHEPLDLRMTTGWRLVIWANGTWNNGNQELPMPPLVPPSCLFCHCGVIYRCPPLSGWRIRAMPLVTQQRCVEAALGQETF